MRLACSYHDTRAHENCLLATQYVACYLLAHQSHALIRPVHTKPYRGTGTEETAKRVATDSNSLIIRSLRWSCTLRRELHVNLREISQERLQRQKAAQNTLGLLAMSRARTGWTHLIVAEQRKVDTSNDCDSDVEPRARKTIEPLHLGWDRSRRACSVYPKRFFGRLLVRSVAI